MTSTYRNFIAALSTAAVLALGTSGAALAQQGMPTATNSELDGSWVDASAASTASAGTFGRAYSFGYPVEDGSARTDVPSAERGASVVFESENGTWVDASRRSNVDTRNDG